MGLGVHGGGTGAAQFFADLGADVSVTDLKNKQELASSLKKLEKFQNIEYYLENHPEHLFKDSDLIIKNPDVPNDSPYLEIAQKNNIPIDTDIGIFFNLCPAHIIGITGTKGKSTTTALIHHLLKDHHPTILAGNIRASNLSLLQSASQDHYVIMELSSWQLEGLEQHQKSPHTAVVTRLDKDHLNRYASLEEYWNAKKLILQFQSPDNHIFLNARDPHQQPWTQEAPGRIKQFDARELSLELLNNLPLPGEHNVENASAAIAVAKHFGLTESKIITSLQNFKGLEGRLQLAARKNEVRFYNDTTATAPVATIGSLQSFDRPVILIAGGMDKKLDYAQLAKTLPKTVKKLILMPGDASQKIKNALRENHHNALDLQEVKNIQEAVHSAWHNAKEGDIVLLSPAAASFNQYQHEFERGQDFINKLKEL